MNRLVKKIISLLSILLTVSMCSSTQVSAYFWEFEKLTPKLQQLFIDEAKRRMDMRFRGYEPRIDFTLEDAVRKLFPRSKVVVPGKCENGKLTKITTEDINSLSVLRFQVLEFEYCDLTDVCFDGIFKNYLLRDIYFSLCEPRKEELNLSREGWDWWEFGSFHRTGVDLESYY